MDSEFAALVRAEQVRYGRVLPSDHAAGNVGVAYCLAACTCALAVRAHASKCPSS
jgi:hypothetical protein